MTIPLAFARIATAFSAAGLGPYVPAVARWPGTPAYDDGGSITTPGTPIAKSCMVQVDVATQKMRTEVGYVDKDVALLVLVTTIDRELDTDATVEVTAGPHAGSYSVQSTNKDSMATHWICRARLSL